jgi:hypothetical protein
MFPRAAGAVAASVELATPVLVFGGENCFSTEVGDKENQKEGAIDFKSIVQSRIFVIIVSPKCLVPWQGFYALTASGT